MKHRLLLLPISLQQLAVGSAERMAEEITAKAEEASRRNRIGTYQVRVTNQEGIVVALFKGTVFSTGKDWELER